MELVIALICTFALIGLAFFATFKITAYERENHELQNKCRKLEESYGSIQELQETWRHYKVAIQNFQTEKETLEKSLENLRNLTSEAHLDFEKTTSQTLLLRQTIEDQEKILANAKTQQEEQLQTWKNLRLKELQDSYQDFEHIFLEKKRVQEEELTTAIEKLQTNITTKEQQLKELETYISIALEQNRLDQEQDSRHFLKLSPTDRVEIAELMDLCAHLRNPLPLYKAIYDIYYKTPYGVLLDDLGTRGKTGIYKITDISNGKMYVGQSVDVGERWKQHIKRGCKAELGTVSGSKLYSAMVEHGIWNFKFELLQECTKEELNKTEKFWISYFNSTEYGYNMKAGG